MKILYYFKEKDVVMDQWQRTHIFHELAQHDIQIDVFNPLKYPSMVAANEALIELIKEKPTIDLFMTAHGKEELFRETIQAIKKAGYPTLLIAFDNLVVPYMHEGVAELYDLVWLTSKETQSIFDKWGAKTIFQPYAANPYIYRPYWNKPVNRSVFIGTPYGSRVNIINDLTENQQAVSLFGNFKFDDQPFVDIPLILEKQPMAEALEALVPKAQVAFDWQANDAVEANKFIEKQSWQTYANAAKNLVRFPIGRKIVQGAIKQKLSKQSALQNNDHLFVHGPLPSDLLGIVYSNFSLSLASTGARNTGVLKQPVNIVNLRSFEIPMSGGLQFCAYFDELADYFEEDKEILFYRSREEEVDKARYYTDPKNQDQVFAMKKMAYIKAKEEHNWYRRFERVFEALGIS